MVALAVLSLTGCSLPPRLPKVSIGKITAAAPKDAGSPATVATREEKGTLEVPAGTRVLVTQEDATPATASTPYLPARTLTEWNFSLPATFAFSLENTQGSTGTVDTSVSKHRIDVEDRRVLLWVAICCGVAGLFVKSLLPKWPSLSNGLLIASPCAFAAWKFAEVPSWLWIGILVCVVFLALGYKRAEWDRDGDGIPDALQKKS